MHADGLLDGGPARQLCHGPLRDVDQFKGVLEEGLERLPVVRAGEADAQGQGRARSQVEVRLVDRLQVKALGQIIKRYLQD